MSDDDYKYMDDESIWPQCTDCGLPMLDPSDHDCPFWPA